MNHLDLSKVQKIWFTGIGGIAMSASAGLAKLKDFEVAGSDEAAPYSPSKEVLDTKQITYTVPYNAEVLADFKPDLVVVSAGVPDENPEVLYAEEQQIPTCSFPELLRALAADEIRVVIAGTHGKSTTSGLIGYALSSIDHSSYMVGGVLQQTNSNFFSGDGHYFVFEGDEYKSRMSDPTPKFNYYEADILVFTNLELDHPDMYESLEALEQEFTHALENLPPDGIVVYNGDDLNLHKLVFNSNRPAFSYGSTEEANVKLISATPTTTATQIEVQVKFNEGVFTERYTTKLVGDMNVSNVLACITLLRSLGFTPELIENYVSQYTGIKRRFEIVGQKNGVTVIDDYAHHPTAVRETLHAARTRYPKARIHVVFEPHTFSRTEQLLTEYATAFNDADQVLLAPIYAAREQAGMHTITTEQLREAIVPHNPHVTLIRDKAEAKEKLQTANPGDVILVMAVGAFHELAHDLIA